MLEAPKFNCPDGELREEFIFSSTASQRFFSGTTTEDTVFMQVSVRGSEFLESVDLVAFEGDKFIIPNPSVYPDGLRLLVGDNEVRVRAVTTSGATTKEAFVNVKLVRDPFAIRIPPSGLRIERFDGVVKLMLKSSKTIVGYTVADGSGRSAEIRGYNFYASTEPEGGTLGYSRINPDISAEFRVVWI